MPEEVILGETLGSDRVVKDGCPLCVFLYNVLVVEVLK